mgnify:CR=1 FL=1|jgi:hypothetical protein|tara:strand:- start:229 stop:336 length:108 start_codon:yes stop_codon:yes gene_type:complete
MEAKHTTISTMVEMLLIHGEVEKYKSEEIQKQIKK